MHSGVPGCKASAHHLCTVITAPTAVWHKASAAKCVAVVRTQRMQLRSRAQQALRNANRDPTGARAGVGVPWPRCAADPSHHTLAVVTQRQKSAPVAASVGASAQPGGWAAQTSDPRTSPDRSGSGPGPAAGAGPLDHRTGARGWSGAPRGPGSTRPERPSPANLGLHLARPPGRPRPRPSAPAHQDPWEPLGLAWASHPRPHPAALTSRGRPSQRWPRLRDRAGRGGARVGPAQYTPTGLVASSGGGALADLARPASIGVTEGPPARRPPPTPIKPEVPPPQANTRWNPAWLGSSAPWREGRAGFTLASRKGGDHPRSCSSAPQAGQKQREAEG